MSRNSLKNRVDATLVVYIKNKNFILILANGSKMTAYQKYI